VQAVPLTAASSPVHVAGWAVGAGYFAAICALSQLAQVGVPAQVQVLVPASPRPQMFKQVPVNVQLEPLLV
jgi:hypothetical protein